MKRITSALILALCTLTLSAQDGIKVRFQGDKPTIKDFVEAYFSSYDEADEEEDYYMGEASNAFRQAWLKNIEGRTLEAGETLMVDSKNGFVLYESKSEGSVLRIEACYWNEADGKHKLFAYNITSFLDGKCEIGQYDGLTFYRYDNARKTMTMIETPGFEQEFFTDDGATVSYDLPRSGKDIKVTYWYDGGKKQQKTLKWTGNGFGKAQ